MVRVAESDFELLSPISELGLYTFNKHIAKHYFCPTCGIQRSIGHEVIPSFGQSIFVVLLGLMFRVSYRVKCSAAN